MPKIVKFRPKRRKSARWTSPSAYGVPEPARFWQDKPKRRRNWNAGLAWLAILLAVFAWVAWDSRLFGEPDKSSLAAQEVDMQWSYCGLDRGRACVVDGDTFRIGRTDFRLVGIDTPEREARCEREALKAEAARAALLTWLNEGPFMMEGRASEPVDRYGRQLREVWREEGGYRRSLARAMVDAGLARDYNGGARTSWCI